MQTLQLAFGAMTEVVASFQAQISAMMADPESPMRRFMRAAAQLQVEMEVAKRDLLAAEGRVEPDERS